MSSLTPPNKYKDKTKERKEVACLFTPRRENARKLHYHRWSWPPLFFLNACAQVRPNRHGPSRTNAPHPCFVLFLNLVFLSRYMRPCCCPCGQWRAFLYNLFLPRTSLRCHSEVSPPSTLRPLAKHKIKQKKEIKENKTL